MNKEENMNKEHEDINTLLVSISYGLSVLELTKKMNEEIEDCPLLLNGPLKEEAMQKVSEANAAIADALGLLYRTTNYSRILSVITPGLMEKAAPELSKLDVLDKLEKYGIKYIARDSLGTLYGFEIKPDKRNGRWQSLGKEANIQYMSDWFCDVKWTDDEPISIEKLLEGK